MKIFTHLTTIKALLIVFQVFPEINRALICLLLITALQIMQ